MTGDRWTDDDMKALLRVEVVLDEEAISAVERAIEDVAASDEARLIARRIAKSAEAAEVGTRLLMQALAAGARLAAGRAASLLRALIS